MRETIHSLSPSLSLYSTGSSRDGAAAGLGDLDTEMRLLALGAAKPGRRLLGASLLAALFLSLLAGPREAQAAADLYIKDTPADTGVEPNPDTGPMWVSEDIWVRQNAISGYQPYAFSVDPAWLTALSPLHQNPEYRDPKYSKPNYVYVRVRNRGSSASSGAERLRVYWAKASTGLSWPSQWVDYVANNCGPSTLYGIELTKPRKNAATATAAERLAYINAINAIDSTPALKWLMDSVTYWDKQAQVHKLSAEHFTPAFLPWHRELLSRYETLLREADPTVTLLYWDWTTDSENSTGGFNFMTTSFMGTAHGVLGAPFTSLHANGICANSRDGWVFPVTTSCSYPGGTPTCTTHPSDWTYPPPNIYRNKCSGVPPASSDVTILSPVTYPSFRTLESNPHGTAHIYLGGCGCSQNAGNLAYIPAAAEDPFFFLLHANCDRLWATWQRNISNIGRRDPATVYGTESSQARIIATMQPWDGSSAIAPWTGGVGSYTYAKTPKDASVVDPPIYDTALLTVPVLQAGESCVIEIPWNPPNPADFSCFGADQGHVCLLARIETSTTSPFGMTTLEGLDVNLNTKNNNNIAWKNITVQDLWPGPLMIAPTWLRNLDVQGVTQTRLSVHLASNDFGLFNAGALYLNLGPDLYQRWSQNGGQGQGIERVPGTLLLQVFGQDAFVSGIPLNPNEAQQVELQLRLQPNYPDPKGQVYHLDLSQYAQTPGTPDQLIGGQRVEFNFNKLVLAPTHAQWRYWDTGQFPGDTWRDPNYDDSNWAAGRAELGFGDGDETTVINGGPPDQRHITTWFRYTFGLEDPSLYRNLWLLLKADDGAVVYLNGVEIQRTGLPTTALITPDTLATTDVEGLAEKVFFPTDVSHAITLLRPGANILAVEVHQSSATSDDLSFDLELCANLGTPQFPPKVALSSPADASLHLAGQAVMLRAEAIDPDGQISSVAFFSDGQPLGTSSQTPYLFNWINPPPGRHQIMAQATDNSGLTGCDFVTIQVLSNVPPVVMITSPADHLTFSTADSIPLAATASDVGGNVARVDYYLRPHQLFGDLGNLVGSSTMAPYAASLKSIMPGDYMLNAIATDNQGLSAQGIPVIFHVVTPPVLTIRYQAAGIVIDWVPAEAILESAPSAIGPWQPVSNATPPLSVQPGGTKTTFYRARVP